MITHLSHDWDYPLPHDCDCQLVTRLLLHVGYNKTQSIAFLSIIICYFGIFDKYDEILYASYKCKK